MKALKVVGILLAVYVLIVAAFETWLGYAQPSGGSTVVITTVDGTGESHDRVVSRLDHGGSVYVAANHWPRAWYRRALRNPEMTLTMDGEEIFVTAVRVEGDEFDQVNGSAPLPLFFKALTGFPPRRLLRLDPT